MFQIPEKKLPDFLRDEERINVLFAPLRSKTVNPKDWENKIGCWKIIIKLYCECNDVYSFTLSSLNTVFVRHGRPPTCLSEVLLEMIRTEEIQSLEVFLRKNSESWSGWAAEILIKKPLFWSYNKLKNSVFTLSNTDQSYVHLEVMKSKSEILISCVPNKFRNKLINFKDLLEVTDENIGHPENVKLLLHLLTKNKKVYITTLTKTNSEKVDNILIKFGDGDKVTPISEIDIGVYTLEQNEQLISKHIETMEEEIENCLKEAKMHLTKNHKQMAKSCLIKKHKIEKRLLKKMNALHNVQTLIEQIKDSHTDTHVWEAYKNALSAFNTTYKETGMTEDAVESTMLELGEMLDIHEDIQSALAHPAADLDSSDLEEELAELIKADDSSNQPPNDDSGVTDDLEKQLEKLSLPDVPEISPNISTQVLLH